MKTIILEVEVRDGEVVVLNQKLDQTEEKFKDVEKQSVKTSATTTDGAKDATKQMTVLGKAAKKAGISMRTAFIATGIGLFVVAIALVVGFWDEIVEAVTQANKRLQEQIDLTNTLQDLNSKDIENKKKQIELAKLQGKAYEQLQKQLISLVEDQQVLTEKEQELLENKLLNLEAGLLELNTREKILKTVLNTLQAGSGDAFILDKQLETLTEIERIRGLIKDTTGDQLDLEIELFKLRNPEAGDPTRGDVTSVGSGGLSAAGALEISNLEGLNDAKIVLEEEFTAFLRGQAAVREGIAILEGEARLKALQFTAHALSAIGNAVGRNTAAGKALAISGALINTYLGISNVWAEKSEAGLVGAGLVQRIAASAIVAAQGFANVKRLMAVKVPGGHGGGGGFSTGGLSGGGAAVPQLDFNVVGDTGINQLGNLLGEELGKERRSYILWQDIKKNQRVEDNSVFESQV